MERTCSADGHCLLGPGSGGLCDSHDDCGANEICTTAGECVTSPGGGPGKHASDATETTESDVVADTAVDTGPTAPCPPPR